MSDVQIKGRVTRNRPQDLYIMFRPEAPGYMEPVMLPKSQIGVVRDVDGDLVTMPEWLARKKGLEEYA